MAPVLYINTVCVAPVVSKIRRLNLCCYFFSCLSDFGEVRSAERSSSPENRSDEKERVWHLFLPRIARDDNTQRCVLMLALSLWNVSSESLLQSHHTNQRLLAK